MNNINADLNIFSHLTELNYLDFGTVNQFYGSLRSLENCKKLEFVDLGQNSLISGGLEYLPLEKLKGFNCHNTAFKGILESFDYDVLAWKLVNHPNLISSDNKVVTDKLKEKFEESEWDLYEIENAKPVLLYDIEHLIKPNRIKRVQRLQSKVKILTKQVN